MIQDHVWVPCFKKRGEPNFKLRPIDGVKSFTNKESCELHIKYVRVKAMGVNDLYLSNCLEKGYTVNPVLFTRGR